MLIERDEIISATQMVKSFAYCREKAKQLSKVIIFKNNKPDLALVDINEFEKMLNEIKYLKSLSNDTMVEDKSKDDNAIITQIALSKK